MITVEVLSVEQKFDFATKEVKNHIVLKFGERLVRAEVPDIDEVAAVISAGLEAPVALEEPVSWSSSDVEPQVPAAEPQVPAAEPQVPAAEPPVTPSELPVVSWEGLPDDVLPQRLKAAMKHLDCPPSMAVDKVESLRESIEESFTQEDWSTVLGVSEPAASPVAVTAPLHPPAPSPPPQPSPPRDPEVGKVTWANGQPMMPTHSRPSRVVQKDSYGYPIVQDAGVDPSQILGAASGAADESGVGQF